MTTAKVTSRNYLSVPTGNYSLGHGLYYCVRGNSRLWFYRYQVDGKRFLVPVGDAKLLSLTQARDRVSELTIQRKQGESIVTKAREMRKGSVTFGAYYESIKPRIKTLHPVTERTLKAMAYRMYTFAMPILSNKPMGTIDRHDILKALNLCHERAPSQMYKLRSELEEVFAIAELGHVVASNPCTWKNNLALLAPRGYESTHHYSLEVSKAAGLIQSLHQLNKVSVDCFIFCVLTAARIGEVTTANWEDIDFDNALWIQPEGSNKMRREHRIPLSKQALAILSKYRRDSGRIFVGRLGGFIDRRAIYKPIKEVSGDDAVTIHGFRSTFRDWCADEGIPFEVAERCLAHVDRSAVVRAYLRSDMLDKRREVMQQWADTLLGKGD